MKRTWVGAAFMVVILVLGLWTEKKMGRVQEMLGESLKKTASAAESGNWEIARSRLETAENQWRVNREFLEFVSGTGTVQEIDERISELTVLTEQKNREDFLPACKKLISRIGTTAEFYAWFPIGF